MFARVLKLGLADASEVAVPTLNVLGSGQISRPEQLDSTLWARSIFVQPNSVPTQCRHSELATMLLLEADRLKA